MVYGVNCGLKDSITCWKLLWACLKLERARFTRYIYMGQGTRPTGGSNSDVSLLWSLILDFYVPQPILVLLLWVDLDQLWAKVYTSWACSGLVCPNCFFCFFKRKFLPFKNIKQMWAKPFFFFFFGIKCGLNSFFFYVCCGFVKSLIHIIIRFDLSPVFYVLDLIKCCHLSKNCQYLMH